MASSLTFLDFALALLGIYIVKLLLAKKAGVPLPPGPRRLPFIGNVLDMPQQHEWLTFADWAERYGEMMSVTLFGQPMIILNTAKLAMDLLDKKSAIYSDRPVMTFGGEMVGWKNTLVLLRYGDRFREYRRFLHQLIGGRTQVARYHALGEVETRNFLQRTLRKPDEVHSHIRHMAGAIILMMAYGYKIQDGHDPYVEQVEKAVDQFSLSTRPGAFLADIFPALRYLPSWFPGASFQTTAASWRKTLQEMADIPFDMVKRHMADYTNTPNFTSQLLETEKLVGDKEFNIKWAAASLYSGGADTTVSATYSFFLAMTLFPDAQRKAQEEIDRVVGTDRLPTSADRDQLPYVEALMKEVLRWNPVTPLGAPHRVLEDDVCGDYLIPKGAIVIANIWKFLHEPAVYEDPFNFLPDRFIDREGKAAAPDSRNYCFGFGRRICPGMHLADSTIWLSIAMSLAVFNITKAVENGQIIEPQVEYTDGTISHPKPFKCSIKPRFAKAEALILAGDMA